jgi:O-antigen/teichoic acid export membrane protein
MTVGNIIAKIHLRSQLASNTGSQERATSNSSNLRAAAGRGIVWAAAERWGGLLLNVIVFTVLARLLDQTLFGTIALGNLYIAFIQIFVTQGIAVAIIQRKDLCPADLDTAFWINFGTAAVLATVTVMFRHQLAILLGNEEVAPVLGWLALALPLSALTVVPMALLSRELKFRLMAARSLFATIISGAVAIGCAVLGLGVWSLVFQQLTAACASTLLLWWTISWRPGVQVNHRALAHLAPFSASMVGNDLLWLTSQRVDQGFIGRALGVEALGAYSVSFRLVALGVEGITGPAAAVAMPIFSGIQDERYRLARAFVKATSLMCSIAFPFFLGLMLVSPILIPTVFGVKWQSAIVPMQILCVAASLRAMQTFVHPTMMVLGKTGIYTVLFALYAGCSTIGSFLTVQYGVAAVAWAVATAAGITGVANFAVLSRFLRFSFFSLVRALWPILAACVMLALAVMAVDRIFTGHVHGFAIVAVQVTVGAAAYMMSIALFDPQLWREFCSTTKLLARR